MSYIQTNIQQPGIVELLFYKGSTGKALSNLAQTLLHGPSNLSPGERELIASYVSRLNECEFCHQSHQAVAKVHYANQPEIPEAIYLENKEAYLSPKMLALLAIAAKVQKNGKEVQKMDIEEARKSGANDEEIHDTVLIAAAFCMFNRYVDGLGTSLPENKSDYEQMGQRLAKKGYRYPPLFLRKWVIKMMGKKKK